MAGQGPGSSGTSWLLAFGFYLGVRFSFFLFFFFLLVCNKNTEQGTLRAWGSPGGAPRAGDPGEHPASLLASWHSCSAWPSQRIRELLPASSQHFRTSWQRTPALQLPPSRFRQHIPTSCPVHTPQSSLSSGLDSDRREENILWNLYVFVVDFAQPGAPCGFLALQGLVPGDALGRFLPASSYDGALNHLGEREAIGVA